MARRRLRHKLMLGLALVAGSVGLLAGGACYGFYAYYTSTKTTNKKLDELTIANQMIETLNSLDQADQNDPRIYLQQIQTSQQLLGVFREVNKRTVDAGLDPDGGEQEAGLMEQLDKQLSVGLRGPECPAAFGNR